MCRFGTCLRKICDRRKQESIVPDTCRRRCVKFGNKGPSTKYATLFWNNFDSPFACHTLSHISRPPKVAWHLGPPSFSSAYIHTYIHTYTHTFIHTYIAYSHTYIHTYLHTHVYIYIHTHIYMPLQWVCIIVRGGFIWGVFVQSFCLDGFVRGGFVLPPFCQNISVTIES